MSDWKSVKKDGYPPPKTKVITYKVMYGGNSIGIDWQDWSNNPNSMHGITWDGVEWEITHWMPLPPEPYEGD